MGWCSYLCLTHGWEEPKELVSCQNTALQGTGSFSFWASESCSCTQILQDHCRQMQYREREYLSNLLIEGRLYLNANKPEPTQPHCWGPIGYLERGRVEWSCLHVYHGFFAQDSKPASLPTTGWKIALRETTWPGRCVSCAHTLMSWSSHVRLGWQSPNLRSTSCCWTP